MQTLVFRSKVDLWLVLVLLVALVVVIMGVVRAVTAPQPQWFMALFLLLVGAGLPVWLLVSTRYELSDTELLVISGPVHVRVALSDVQSVEPSHSLLASPALSLDRLRIRFGKYNSVLISPRDKELFLRELDVRRHKTVQR